MSERKSKVDFYVTDHGSVITIQAVSSAAIEHANEFFEVPSWMGVPTRFTTDHRPAMQLCEQLDSEGYVIGRL
jgi:hypothetical protein